MAAGKRDRKRGPSTNRQDEKAEALRRRGCLHPHPEQVSDELFASGDFFDRRDLLQVKYEMVRRVRADKRTVVEAASAFGLSRPAFYQAAAALRRGGLGALLPHKPGPRRAHKLSEAVVDFLAEHLWHNPETSVVALAQLIEQRFALSVHRRSIERALRRREKKLPPPRQRTR